MNDVLIPFNRPSFAGNEQAYMADAIHLGHASGDGAYTRKCHAYLEEALGVPKALLTTSCTHALEMAALLLNLTEGDEVIVPSFTFVSTVNAFILRGARPVFIDIRSDTLNMDEWQLEGLISERTRAIVPVHYAGVACAMDTIMEIAGRHGVPVVEDNAHALFGKFKGRYLGTFGALATQSFHETKNFTCGEGGALLINDPHYIERAEVIREKGTNRSRFFRGQVDKYTWVDIGSSYLPSDILAAFLFAQLSRRDQIQAKRRQIWLTYEERLAGWAAANGVRLPIVPAECEQVYHMFYLLLPTLADRQRLIAHLKERNIIAVFHYLPLHRSPMGQRWPQPADCPVTDDASDRLLRLPFYNDFSVADQDRVIAAIEEFTCQ